MIPANNLCWLSKALKHFTVSTTNQRPALSPNLSQREQIRRRRQSKSASAKPVCTSAGLNGAGRRYDGGACGYSDRTTLLTHMTRALTLIHNSHRHNTHTTHQVHTLHRQTCTHRTYILFSARGHAGAQQLEGLKAQLLRKADFPVMPPRLRWGQRGTVRGDGRRPTGEL